MTIFITGIAGFIGFHLALALSKQGRPVLGCDNFNPYYDVRLKKERARHLASLGIPVIEADIRDGALLKSLLQENRVVSFVHLAAQAGVRHSLTHPQSYVESNLDGFVQVLEAVRAFPGMKLIYASSSSVYGKSSKIPFSENACTMYPSNLYGATKQANESMAYAYHHMFNISVTGLRYFTVYGPWGRPDMAYYAFANAIMQGKPVKVYGDGSMRRDFTYIDDIIAGTVAAIDRGAPCEVFNLGNHQPHTVAELVSNLEGISGKKALIEYLPEPPGEVPATYADISKSQKMLGFYPRTPFVTGLARFFEWFVKFDSQTR